MWGVQLSLQAGRQKKKKTKSVSNQILIISWTESLAKRLSKQTTAHRTFKLYKYRNISQRLDNRLKNAIYCLPSAPSASGESIYWISVSNVQENLRLYHIYTGAWTSKQGRDYNWGISFWGLNLTDYDWLLLQLHHVMDHSSHFN